MTRTSFAIALVVNLFFVSSCVAHDDVRTLDWRIVAAGSVVSILPVLILFVLLQRFILPSASDDAVKG